MQEESSMRAHTGDWLIVKGRTDTGTARRAMVLEAHGPDGSAPFLVRWIESGHQALVFPGPDAVVVTAAEQAEQDRATGRRIDFVQSALEKDGDDSAARGI
jgi:Domain of unknown function (DUF1918)